MRRGELYRVKHPSARDPRKQRFFVITSRQALVDTRFSTVICAPVYTTREGLSTEVPIGIEEGMKHECAIHCDELVSLPKALLTDYVSLLSQRKLELLDRALAVALDLPQDLEA